MTYSIYETHRVLRSVTVRGLCASGFQPLHEGLKTHSNGEIPTDFTTSLQFLINSFHALSFYNNMSVEFALFV